MLPVGLLILGRVFHTGECDSGSCHTPIEWIDLKVATLYGEHQSNQRIALWW